MSNEDDALSTKIHVQDRDLNNLLMSDINSEWWPSIDLVEIQSSLYNFKKAFWTFSVHILAMV